MKTIIAVYVNGVFCQEESDSSLLANGAADQPHGPEEEGP